MLRQKKLKKLLKFYDDKFNLCFACLIRFDSQYESRKEWSALHNLKSVKKIIVWERDDWETIWIQRYICEELRNDPGPLIGTIHKATEKIIGERPKVCTILLARENS